MTPFPLHPLSHGREGEGEGESKAMKTITISLFFLILSLLLLGGCATTKPEVQAEPPAAYIGKEAETQKEIFGERESKDEQGLSIEEKWGIRVLNIRQSANGYMLDFRYRVLDPDKASHLFNRKEKPYLIDQESGARFMVPSSPKIGPLRQTSLKPIANRNYFILFANPGKYVKVGNKVTVVIGEFRAENLVVE